MHGERDPHYRWMITTTPGVTVYLASQEIWHPRSYTVVSRIYAPPFCNLSASRKCRGAYMQDLTFYLANTPPLPMPRLDVDIGTLYYRPIDLPSLLILSSTEPQKLDGQDRLTEVGTA